MADIATLGLVVDASGASATTKNITADLRVLKAEGAATRDTLKSLFAPQVVGQANQMAAAMQRMKAAAQQSQNNDMIAKIQAQGSWEKAARAIAGTAGSVDKVTKASGEGHLAIGRVNMALEGLAFESLGANAKLGSIGTKFAEFGVGGLWTGAVLAGLAAIAYAWDKITDSARKAEEEQKAAAVSITTLRDKQRNPIFGDVPHQKSLLEQQQQDLAEEMKQASDMRSRFGQISGPAPIVGLFTRALFRDPEKIKKDLAETTNLIQAATKEIARLKAVENEPARQALVQVGVDQKSLDVLADRVNRRQDEYQLSQAQNAADLAARESQIRESFRQIDAEGKVKKLTAEQLTARQALLTQARIASGLRGEELQQENQIALNTNDAQREMESSSIRERLHGRLAMIEIERQAEIKKLGDVEGATLRSEEKIRQAYKQTAQEVFQKLQSIYSSFVGPALQLADPRAAKVGDAVSSAASAAAAGFQVGGPWGAAAAGVLSLTNSIVSFGKTARDEAEKFNQASRAFITDFSLYYRETKYGPNPLDEKLTAAKQLHDQYAAQIESLYAGKKLEDYRNTLLHLNDVAYQRNIENIRKQTDALDGLSQAMLNVVEGYRLQSTIFKATTPRGGPLAPPVPHPYTSPGGQPLGDLRVAVVLDSQTVGSAVIRNFRTRSQAQTGDASNWTELRP